MLYLGLLCKVKSYCSYACFGCDAAQQQIYQFMVNSQMSQAEEPTPTGE